MAEQMALRTDERQWLIYDPHTVDMAFKALEASALFMYGNWLQSMAKRLPTELSTNIGQIGVVIAKIGDARQQIQAGLAPNDIPDELVEAQRGLDLFHRWLEDNNVPMGEVVEVIDQLAGAMTYLDQRTHDTGTNHPRWNSRLVSGQSCESCGR